MNADWQEARGGCDKSFSAGRFLLLLGLLLFIFFPGILLGTSAFFYRDAGLFGYPVAYYLRDSIRGGHWPLWNPYNNCGLPFLAQWNTLALYPPSLVYVVLPLPWSLNLFLLAHILWAGLGAYALAWHWFGSRFGASVAGLAFAWNGLSLHCLMWPCHIAALAWMPWVILACAHAASNGRCALFLAALAGACQLTTGSPEVILFTWLVAIVGWVFDLQRRKGPLLTEGGRLLAAAFLAAAVSAAQLLPWLDLTAQSERSSSFGGSDWSLPWWGPADFLAPLFRAQSSVSGVFMQAEQQWTSSYYLGVLPLFLALIALRRRPSRTLLLAGLALAGMLLALGDAGFVLPAVKKMVPLLGFSRYPVKFIVVTVFALSLLAGAGAAWLGDRPACPTPGVLAGPGVALLLGILLVLAMGVRYYPSNPASDFLNDTLIRMLLLTGGVLALAMMLWRESASLRVLAGFAFLLLAGLDVGTYAPRQNPTVPAQAYAEYPPPMSAVPSLGKSRAMLSPAAEITLEHLVNPDPLRSYLGQRAELFSDCNLLERIPKVDGFFSLHLAWEQKVAELLREGKAAARLPSFLGVSQVASPKLLFVWDAQTNFLPLATIGQEPAFVDDSQALAALGSDKFSPLETVYLPADARGLVRARADSTARVLSSKVSPAECVFEAATATPALLVVAQSYAHCWKATVDGKPAALWRANYAFQAVEVPAGRHVIRLAYVDRAFQIGAGISGCALVFCVAGWFNARRQTVQGAR